MVKGIIIIMVVGHRLRRFRKPTWVSDRVAKDIRLLNELS